VEKDHLHVVILLPKNIEAIKEIIKQEIEYNGISVIIPRRECVQTKKRNVKFCILRNTKIASFCIL